jgi:hypothetical protein
MSWEVISALKVTAIGQEIAEAEWQDIGGSENSMSVLSPQRSAISSRPSMLFAGCRQRGCLRSLLPISNSSATGPAVSPLDKVRRPCNQCYL